MRRREVAPLFSVDNRAPYTNVSGSMEPGSNLAGDVDQSQEDDDASQEKPDVTYCLAILLRPDGTVSSGERSGGSGVSQVLGCHLGAGESPGSGGAGEGFY